MKNNIKLHDKEFEIYLEEEKLQTKIKAMASQITEDYRDKQPIILSILNGSFIFTADLVRYFDFPMTIEFVRYSSYEGTESTGQVTKMLGMKSDIAGQGCPHRRGYHRHWKNTSLCSTRSETAKSEVHRDC